MTRAARRVDKAPTNAPDDAQLLEILQALRACRDHPETQPARLAGYNPRTLAAAIDALAAHGCHFSQGPHGVVLEEVGLGCYRDLICAASISEGWAIAREVRAYRQTASTNDVCWQLAADERMHGVVVLAEEQTRGRGRRGTPWLARPGQSVLMSLLLRELPAAHIDELTLLLGLACAEAVDTLADAHAQIKWPNDVLLGGRKVAGVLVEARQIPSTLQRPPALPKPPALLGGHVSNRRTLQDDPPAEPGAFQPHAHHDHWHIVLGIGLNVGQARSDFAPELAVRATSLYQATGRRIDRLDVVLALLAAIDRRCLRASVPAAADHWIAQWKARCPMLGTTVTARVGGHILTGQVLDIDPLQGLVLRDVHGVTHHLSARTSTLSGV